MHAVECVTVAAFPTAAVGVAILALLTSRNVYRVDALLISAFCPQLINKPVVQIL
jgi:hypothetical protein